MLRLVLIVLAAATWAPSTGLAQEAAVPAAGQSSAASSEPTPPTGEGATFKSLFSELGHELKHLGSKETVVTAAVGGALALAAHPGDRALINRVTETAPLDAVLENGGATGSGWVQAGAALGTFVIGRTSGSHRVQAVGADLVQVQIVTSVLTQSIKLAVNRTRPDDGRFSFPSGHAAATFANATVLERQFGWKIGIPAYGVAAYVAASRLQDKQHYASDVIFGAAIGVVAGRAMTIGQGDHPFRVEPVAVPGGCAVLLSRIE